MKCCCLPANRLFLPVHRLALQCDGIGLCNYLKCHSGLRLSSFRYCDERQRSESFCGKLPRFGFHKPLTNRHAADFSVAFCVPSVLLLLNGALSQEGFLFPPAWPNFCRLHWQIWNLSLSPGQVWDVSLPLSRDRVPRRDFEGLPDNGQ
jgi:hypothetical protein